MNFVDTSVIVPAVIAAHDAHVPALRAMDGAHVTAHAHLEAYSVLTRLPAPHRLDGGTASRILGSWFPRSRVIAPSGTLATEVVERLAESGVVGGAAYDGLIALTVAEHGGVLLSRDERALGLYKRLGLSVQFVA